MAVVKDNSRSLTRDRTSFSSSLPRQTLYKTRTQSATYAHNRSGRRRGSNLTPAALSSALLAVNGHEAVNTNNAKPLAQTRIALSAINTGAYPTPSDVREHNLSSSAVTERPSLSVLSDKAMETKQRRASDNQLRSMEDKKRPSAAELKCDQCGKTYKHSSCLTKHLWEHTPEWGLTSKLLISKHQQVQLLEAASVLLAMNQDAAEPVPGGSDNDDFSSRQHSTSSDNEHAISSGDDESPPPMAQGLTVPRKHYSPISSGYSNSYQSVFSTTENVIDERGYGQRTKTPDRNIDTASTSYNAMPATGDQADLAAAVGLLSCSYAGSLPVSQLKPVSESPHESSEQYADAVDVDMAENGRGVDEHTANKSHSRGREDDEGVFGNMEE